MGVMGKPAPRQGLAPRALLQGYRLKRWHPLDSSNVSCENTNKQEIPLHGVLYAGSETKTTMKMMDMKDEAKLALRQPGMALHPSKTT